MKTSSYSSLFCSAFFVLALSGCSPKYDWREIKGSSAPYVVMLPGKPASHTRDLTLDGNQVSMTMTATEVDGATFAVADAQLPDAARAKSVLQAMKEGMVRNIGGKVTREKAEDSGGQSMVELDATGQAAPGGQPRHLSARFIQKGQRVYQVIVLSTGKPVEQEQIDTFLTSFQAN
jgi:hypothetical protein